MSGTFSPNTDKANRKIDGGHRSPFICVEVPSTCIPKVVWNAGSQEGVSVSRMTSLIRAISCGVPNLRGTDIDKSGYCFRYNESWLVIIIDDQGG